MDNKKEKLFVLLCYTILTTSCSKHESRIPLNNLEENEIDSDLIIEEPQPKEQLSEELSEVLKDVEDQKIVDHFNLQNERLLNEELVQEEITQILADTVKFLKNEKEIDGKKLEDLTAEAQEDILEAAGTTYEIFEDSGVIDEVTSAYQDIKEIGSILYDVNTSEETKEKVDNAKKSVQDIFSDVAEDIGEIWDRSKDALQKRKQ